MMLDIHELYAEKVRMNALIDKGDLTYADECKLLDDLEICCDLIELQEEDAA